MKPSGPIPPHFSTSEDGQLMIGGRPAEELVAEAGGTLLFAYDNNIVGSQIAGTVGANGLIIPQTSILGAILLAGYLGGATATHARAGEPFWAPILVGVFLWGGLFWRDARLRALIPLRRPA